MVKDIFLQHGSVSDAICFVGNSSITHHHDDRDFSYPESGVGKSGEVVTNGVVFKGRHCECEARSRRLDA